jgi:CheY-like chemotaxis protein
MVGYESSAFARAAEACNIEASVARQSHGCLETIAVRDRTHGSPGSDSAKLEKDGMLTKRILVVEDEVEIRLLLTEVLSDAGFDVVEAKDGDQAMQMLEQFESFDLLVTDIAMPGTADGNAVATRAKTLDPQIPVVYVSGRPESLHNNVGVGDAFIHKPFSLHDVVRVVRVLMDRRGN